MAEIVLDHVSKIYSSGGPTAVSDLSLTIDDGEFIVLVGPSGCGKTTALRMVAGLESITDGTISIGDHVVNTVPPKERDIAMVFQNYALYPHMTVYDNMAFGLKLRKLAKEEIDRRVRQAGEILGLGEFLERKPKAFLMDEPLSNLDAKLRVQMRSEIARIQHDLSTTTLYVTHDQVEAMTMGDRVAVIRKGVLQQVDAPQYLYDHPSNLFVAGFIGSPAMNMVEATLARSNGSFTAEFGGYRLAVPDDVFKAHPDLKGYEGKQVIVGIRPEDMEDAAMKSDSPADHRISSAVILREALGADVLVHFMIKAPAVLTEDAKELAHDVGAEAVEAVERGAMAGESEFLARLNPRTKVQKGQPLELVVDVHRLHFFDPESGQGIYGGDGEPDGSRSS